MEVVVFGSSVDCGRVNHEVSLVERIAKYRAGQREYPILDCGCGPIL